MALNNHLFQSDNYRVVGGASPYFLTCEEINPSATHHAKQTIQYVTCISMRTADLNSQTQSVSLLFQLFGV